MDDNKIFFPALKAIVKCFSPQRHAQTELEAAYKPTLFKVLPMIDDIKQRMTILSSDICSGPEFRPVHELTSLLARYTLKSLNDIPIHDLWGASCVIHPGLSSFSFMSASNASHCKLIGIALAKKILNEGPSN